MIFELSVGESRANPNRRTWQQRQMPTAAPSKPVTRSLRFGFARALAQNLAQPRGFGRPTRVPASPSPTTQTRWRREWDSNPRYLAVHALSKRAPSTTRPSLRKAYAFLTPETRSVSESCSRSAHRRQPGAVAPEARAPVKSRWRRGRDSNPRWGISPYSLSRGAPSAARPPLRGPESS